MLLKNRLTAKKCLRLNSVITHLEDDFRKDILEERWGCLLNSLNIYQLEVIGLYTIHKPQNKKQRLRDVKALGKSFALEISRLGFAYFD